MRSRTMSRGWRRARASSGPSSTCAPSGSAWRRDTGAARRLGGGRLRQPPRSRPAGVPFRREPQLLRGALASLDLLQQGAGARQVLVAGNMLDEPDDIFFLHVTRCTRSSTRPRSAGPWRADESERIWRDEVARRRRIYSALEPGARRRRSRTAGARHRAHHRDALRHHLRHDQPLAGGR